MPTHNDFLSTASGERIKVRGMSVATDGFMGGGNTAGN